MVIEAPHIRWYMAIDIAQQILRLQTTYPAGGVES